jgi:hypothetical protein
MENALVYPLIGADGQLHSPYGYCNLPGITKNPLHPLCWVKGEPKTYYSDAVNAFKHIIVCQRATDVWPLWQSLKAVNSINDFLLISSTHDKVHPVEWMQSKFWTRWEAVYLAFDRSEADDHLAVQLSEAISRDVRRLRPPGVSGSRWDDFWRGGGTPIQIPALMEEAPVMSLQLEAQDESHGGLGRFAYEPLDINGAFKDGYLYCTVQTLSRELAPVRGKTDEGKTEVVERLETVVVRSDRQIHTASWMKAPPGTKYNDRVLRLSDGTLIDREPRSNKYATWSWSSIKAYLENRSHTRPLSQILRDVNNFIRTSVWLPFEEDYTILSLTVPVTFTQSVFDSVPLIFLNGPAGSGKSEAGRSMARVCANAYVCGQSSAASIARFIDESRGFVVLDDLEAIGSRGGEFSELVQALKLSYKKDTAVKLWTDVKTMRTERLNFFGIKMINNTSGADHILGSRMLRIQTRPIPEPLRHEFFERRSSQTYDFSGLRDELHTWAFENVNKVDLEYKKLYPARTDRADEITAPLKVFASLSCDAELQSQLEVSLAKQSQKTFDITDPEQVLHISLSNLIAAGYITVSISHVVLEIRRLLDRDFNRGTADYPEWARPDWVGKQLRRLNLIEVEGGLRKRLFGSNLRFYPIRPVYIEEVKRQYTIRGITIRPSVKDIMAFCQGCEGCVYRDCGCEIMPMRMKAEANCRRANFINAIRP